MSFDNAPKNIHLNGPYPSRSSLVLNSIADAVTEPELWSVDAIDDALASVRYLQLILDTRCKLEPKQVSMLSSSLMAVLQRPSLFHLPFQSQILTCLSILWRRFRRCNIMNPVDWRALFQLLKDIHFAMGCKPSFGGHGVIRAHRDALIKAIARGKRFFPTGSASEIKELLWANGGSPHNLSFHVDFLIAHLFLPFDDSVVNWVPRLIEQTTRIDPCSKVVACVLSILSRTAKHNYFHQKVDLEQYLPLCFHWFLQHLPLSVDGATGVAESRSSQKVWPKELDWALPANALSRYMAKFVVYTIRNESQQAIVLLQRFFQATSTFFHPSNTGAWTAPLADFLSFVSRYFAKLYWKLDRAGRGLSENVVNNFFDAVLPIASDAVYSKASMVLCAQDCLKHLGYIAPSKIFPQILADAKLNLQATSGSNRTVASLGLLAAVCHPLFDRRLYPSGAQHLNAILWAALECFDGINMMKSISALSLFGMAFYMIPLVEGKDRMTDSDEEEEARHATVGFPEWSLAFLEKLCNVLRHFDAVEKTNQRDQGLTRILYRTCRPFFCSLSSSSHLSCIKFLLSFLSDNTQLSSRKYFGVLVRVASLGYPQQAFQHLTLPLIHRITGGVNSSNVGAFFNEQASEQLEWFIYLAACSVRESGGAHLIPYVDQITAVFNNAISSESKGVRKMGRKLMRNTLMALSSVYPTEFRPYASSAWDDPAWKHWQVWGEFAENFKELEQNKAIAWHLPSTEEYEIAQRTCVHVVSKCGSVLLRDLSSVPIEETINQLMNVRAVLEGCLSVAGNFSGEALHKAPLDVRCDPLQVFQPFVVKVGKEESLRVWFTNMVLHVFNYFKASEGKDQSAKPELWRILISLSHQLLNAVVISESSLDQISASNRFAMRSQKEFESGRRCIMRALLVEQTFIRYLQSFHLGRHFLSYTSDVAQLIDCVRWSCMLDFPSVRSASSNALALSCDGFRFLRGSMVNSFTETIRSHNMSDKQVLGALECLRNRNFLSWSTSSWTLIHPVMLAICDSSHHPDDVVQAAVIEFFGAFADRLHRLPLVLSNELQLYTSLCRQLLEISGNGEGKASHWRSQLAAARFLLYALRTDVNPSLEMLNFFWKNCVSDFVPLRRICISALANIVAMFPTASDLTVTYSPVVTTPPSSAALNDLQSELFYDTNDSGWLPSSKCVAFQCSGPTKSSSLIAVEWTRAIENDNSEQFKSFISALEEDHPKLNVSGASKGRTGAGDLIAASIHELMHNRLSWPKTTFLSVHDSMMLEHVVLIQGLCCHCPELIKQFISNSLELLDRNQLSHTFRAAHITASEIFAGVASSSKYWSSRLLDQYRDPLIELLAKGLDKCPSDTVKDWSSAIRYVCTDMDPKRLSWLVSVIGSESLSDDTVSAKSAPSQTFKWLLFLQAIQVEFAWRSPSLNVNLCSKISQNPNLLHSPFSQIRQETSRILCFVLRNGYRPGVDDGSFTSIDGIINSYESMLKPAIAKDWKNPQSELISVLETVIYWVAFCCNIGEPCYTSKVMIRLSEIVIHACHHPNAETAALAKHCLLSVAWSNFNDAELHELMHICIRIVNDESVSFHSHLSAITFFSTLIIRHLFKLDVPRVKAILATYEKLLGNSRIECRETSSKLLTGFLSCAQPLISIKRFSKKFMTEAKSSSSAIAKHSAILALTALIKSEPYRVPEWMPEILAFCAQFIYDSPPIGGTIQKLFTEFKRTHQDTWHIDKEKFTEDQLTAVNEAIVAPSYFA